MALKISRDLKNYIINQGIVKQMAGTMGTGGTCVIKIYTGSQPTDADTAPSGTNSTMLCQILNLGWGGTGEAGTVGATSGTASHSSGAPGYVGTAAETGLAGWARMQTFGTNFTGSAGTYNIDGDVGTGGTCAFIINSASITVNGAVTLLSAPISIA